jgi:hypothetical protein
MLLPRRRPRGRGHPANLIFLRRPLRVLAGADALAYQLCLLNLRVRTEFSSIQVPSPHHRPPARLINPGFCGRCAKPIRWHHDGTMPSNYKQPQTFSGGI